jgi:Na+-driven multidrug efflux pump
MSITKVPCVSKLENNLKHDDMSIICTFPGVLTGCGKQKIGARVNLAAYYLAGIPLAVLFAFFLHLNGMVCTRLLACVIKYHSSISFH